MRRMGSAAPVLDETGMGYTQAPSLDATDFIALEGGHLDARARESLPAHAVGAIHLLVAFALTLVLAGGASIAITAGTIGQLQHNKTVSAQIDDTQSTNDDLRIACSQLSRTERIARIATQNLGMVYANDATRLSLY